MFHLLRRVLGTHGVRDQSMLTTEAGQRLGTQVADLTPLQGLANLQWLDLRGTQFADLRSLRSLKTLKRIWLTDSQKMRKAVEKLKEFLPELDIEFVDPEKEY